MTSVWIGCMHMTIASINRSINQEMLVWLKAYIHYHDSVVYRYPTLLHTSLANTLYVVILTHVANMHFHSSLSSVTMMTMPSWLCTITIIQLGYVTKITYSASVYFISTRVLDALYESAMYKFCWDVFSDSMQSNPNFLDYFVGKVLCVYVIRGKWEPLVRPITLFPRL